MKRVSMICARAPTPPIEPGPGTVAQMSALPDFATLASAYQVHVSHLERAYAAAAERAGYDAIAIHAGAPTAKNRFDDQRWPLSPTPAFSHWLPLVEADAWLVIAPGARPRLIRTAVDDFWEAPPAPAADFFWPAFEVSTAAPGHALDGIALARTAVVTRDPDAAPAGVAAVNPPALLAALDAIRTHKTDYERRCIAEATRRAVPGHLRLASRFATVSPPELSLHLAYLDATSQDDAETPYKNIVAIGRHAATLHHVAYDRRSPGQPAEALLVDAGAQFLGYHCDITRTHVRGSTGLFGDLLARMDELQQEVCRRIRPGLAYEALHDQSHELLAEVLVDLDIAGGRRGSTAALIERGVTRALFPHGLGHSLGLQTHDVGMRLTPPRDDNPYLRNTSEIAVGQVFTIEPGCYIIDPLLEPLRGDDRAGLIDWGAIDALRPFGGIRVEDDVAVVDGGVINFTRDAFDAAGGAKAAPQG
jgi:Xaa-Pro dipeptidase